MIHCRPVKRQLYFNRPRKYTETADEDILPYPSKYNEKKRLHRKCTRAAFHLFTEKSYSPCLR